MIKDIVEFFLNLYIWAAVLSWIVAQSIKIMLNLIKEKKFDLRLYGSTGGMPSAHSATITGITFAIGKSAGFGSVSFAISFVVSIIVITDALHLRREVGRHAIALEKITHSHFDTKAGHKLSEVIYGIIIGAIIGLLL